MKDYKTGQFVRSKAGHEKGKIFVIIRAQEEYIYIADGKSRKLCKPKKKNKKHVQIIHYIDETIQTKINNKEIINDADVMQAIKLFESRYDQIEVGGI